MAELEKGCKIYKLTETAYDANPPEEVKEKIEKFMDKNMSPRHSDRIPIELYGKSGEAYLLQEWHCHKGKGSPRVS